MSSSQDQTKKPMPTLYLGSCIKIENGGNLEVVNNLTIPKTPVDNTDMVNKKYVDDRINQLLGINLSKIEELKQIQQIQELTDQSKK